MHDDAGGPVRAVHEPRRMLIRPSDAGDRLPPNNEVGTWTRVSDIQLVTDLTEFYNRIDGAAPKYIDRGWVSSVYATYSDGTRTIQVAIHDMGSRQVPIHLQLLDARREPGHPGRDNAVLDLGLSHRLCRLRLRRPLLHPTQHQRQIRRRAQRD